MSKPKFRKLYFPGLISLVLLPVMCICYLISNNTFHKYRIMSIAWASKENINREISRPGKWWFNVETFRKYRILNLTGNAKNDAVVLDSLKILLERLTAKKDTVNGINVSFSNKIQYYELVDALDICFADKDEQLAFAPMANKILIAHMSPVKYDSVGLTQDIVLFTDVIYSKPTISDIFIKASKILIEFWPSVLAFILMIYFTINKRKRYFYIHKPQ